MCDFRLFWICRKLNILNKKSARQNAEKSEKFILTVEHNLISSPVADNDSIYVIFIYNGT